MLDASIWQLNAAAESLLVRQHGDLRSQPIDVLIPGVAAHLDTGGDDGRWELEAVGPILTFSRRTRTRTHRTSVRIDALLSETHSLLRAMIPSTVQIIVQQDANGAVVEGHATQLQQLLLNLCSNAEHAMRTTNGGTLTVRASWDVMPDTAAPAVRFTVSDTGVGISPEVRSRMFEPFFTTKPVGEGTGWG